MIDIKNRLKSVSDTRQWTARRGDFMAKVAATKLVWFPPKPEETTKKATSTAKKATKKTTGTAKKVTKGTKKATKPVPGK